MRTLRSLLLSMQGLLARARHRMALGAITAALGLLGAVGAGCESPTETRATDLYGCLDCNWQPDVVEEVAPPPSEVLENWATDLYGIQDYGREGVDLPPPDPDIVENWATDVYGCLECWQPDVANEVAPPPDVSPDGVQVLYGPPPVDVVQEAVPDVEKDCPPMGLYGPPPCSSDAECQADYGANWYCDQTITYPDGCGGTITYPQCKPKE